jgi:hypothetical protein
MTPSIAEFRVIARDRAGNIIITMAHSGPAAKAIAAR